MAYLIIPSNLAVACNYLCVLAYYNILYQFDLHIVAFYVSLSCTRVACSCMALSKLHVSGKTPDTPSPELRRDRPMSERAPQCEFCWLSLIYSPF